MLVLINNYCTKKHTHTFTQTLKRSREKRGKGKIIFGFGCFKFENALKVIYFFERNTKLKGHKIALMKGERLTIKERNKEK